ncbi:MAG: hypothetical protein Q8L06_14360, partial [Pseudohongiella sp.]|nr:hypothetical protein [Pseudohongiella sp.]
MFKYNSSIKAAVLTLSVAAGVMSAFANAQTDFSNPAMTPTNDLPNPYETIEGFLKLPEGRQWGSASAIHVDVDGTSIWVAERCSGNTNACVQNSHLDPVMKFDLNGNLVTSFGAGMIAWPHGIEVDAEGNVWVTDGRDNQVGDAVPTQRYGHQVHKFSPDGQHLMTLGEPGGAREPGYLFQPNDVLVAPDGHIFVAEGHSNAEGSTARILKFNATG